jgi:hypothetical protein
MFRRSSVPLFLEEYCSLSLGTAFEAVRLYRMDDPDKLDSVAAPVDETPDLGGHPLFPRPVGEVGPDPRRFDMIHIERWLPDGTKEVCPRTFSGKELRSWEQVVEIGGGECTYQLRAQCGRTYRYQAYSEKAALDAGFLTLLNTLMQAQANNNAAFLNSNAAILKTILDRGQAQGPNPLEIFREVKPLLGGGGGATEVLKGIEIAKGLLPQAVAPVPGFAPPEEDLTGMLGGILKLIAPAQQASAPAAQPPAPAAAPPSAPPHAPPAAMPPLASPPPGWAWCYTSSGLSLMPAPQVTGAQPQTLREVLADPAMRDRLRTLLAESEPQIPQPATAPAPVPGYAPPPSAAAIPQPADNLGELPDFLKAMSSLFSPKKPMPGEG